ncbi:hypothetical protein BKA93DRAFT_68247 [Sparassis latifolia]
MAAHAATNKLASSTGDMPKYSAFARIVYSLRIAFDIFEMDNAPKASDFQSQLNSPTVSNMLSRLHPTLFDAIIAGNSPYLGASCSTLSSTNLRHLRWEKIVSYVQATLTHELAPPKRFDTFPTPRCCILICQSCRCPPVTLRLLFYTPPDVDDFADHRSRCRMVALVVWQRALSKFGLIGLVDNVRTWTKLSSQAIASKELRYSRVQTFFSILTSALCSQSIR